MGEGLLYDTVSVVGFLFFFHLFRQTFSFYLVN
jgi:hypothetical protein